MELISTKSFDELDKTIINEYNKFFHKPVKKLAKENNVTRQTIYNRLGKIRKLLNSALPKNFIDFKCQSKRKAVNILFKEIEDLDNFVRDNKSAMTAEDLLLYHKLKPQITNEILNILESHGIKIQDIPTKELETVII